MGMHSLTIFWRHVKFAFEEKPLLTVGFLFASVVIGWIAGIFVYALAIYLLDALGVPWDVIIGIDGLRFPQFLLGIAGIVTVVKLSKKFKHFDWFWVLPESEDHSTEKFTYVGQEFEPVRNTPQGTEIIQLSASETILSVKSAIRFWCWAVPIFFLVLASLAMPVGFVIGVDRAMFAGDFLAQISRVVSSVALAMSPFLAGTVVSFLMLRPRVRVVITPSSLRYGAKTYDRNHHSGMRIGYEIPSSIGLKNRVFDQSFGMQALRLTYGRWGEDLPYLVNKYHAPEIVIWLNEQIDAVGAPEPKAHAPEQGERAQSF